VVEVLRRDAIYTEIHLNFIQRKLQIRKTIVEIERKIILINVGLVIV
jgi:hypothetical protein